MHLGDDQQRATQSDQEVTDAVHAGKERRGNGDVVVEYREPRPSSGRYDVAGVTVLANELHDRRSVRLGQLPGIHGHGAAISSNDQQIEARSDTENENGPPEPGNVDGQPGKERSQGGNVEGVPIADIPGLMNGQGIEEGYLKQEAGQEDPWRPQGSGCQILKGASRQLPEQETDSDRNG